MSNNEQWIENAENAALFINESESGGENQLLEISPTNRTIAGKKQAVILATIRFAERYFNTIDPVKTDRYSWMGDLCDIVEEYQLTLDGEQNSRRQFIKVMMAKVMNILRGSKEQGAEIKT
jgi:hypothetical protein